MILNLKILFFVQFLNSFKVASESNYLWPQISTYYLGVNVSYDSINMILMNMNVMC